MTDNPFVFDSEDTPYLKHHFQEKCWYRGKERIDANYFMIDPATMLMGWGKYTSGEGYRSEERRVGKECRSRGSPYH